MVRQKQQRRGKVVLGAWCSCGEGNALDTLHKHSFRWRGSIAGISDSNAHGVPCIHL
jgi:hypothetical protein